MGGKSYYCDYCCCYMKNDLNVRKLHNAGASHTAAKGTYMRRFEDPRKILAAERSKRPCKRFFAGYCRFEQLCNFRHYTDKQMKQLEKIVSQLKKKASKKQRNPQKTKRNLPPSLQPLDLAKLKQTNWDLSWG
ncbi:zinc finger matrin-type protein 5 [Drosophila novamexicana]|uniref:zinc finger matrin-type protein 5 n=1 Tax=Drosophila novamexicana TaxID=47314 RepID=UPI0011E5B379|nr:zinc finger matrin-type protein 5 [Drosophila novamexicana]